MFILFPFFVKKIASILFVFPRARKSLTSWCCRDSWSRCISLFIFVNFRNDVCPASATTERFVWKSPVNLNNGIGAKTNIYIWIRSFNSRNLSQCFLQSRRNLNLNLQLVQALYAYQDEASNKDPFHQAAEYAMLRRFGANRTDGERNFLLDLLLCILRSLERKNNWHGSDDADIDRLTSYATSNVLHRRGSSKLEAWSSKNGASFDHELSEEISWHEVITRPVGSFAY